MPGSGAGAQVWVSSFLSAERTPSEGSASARVPPHSRLPWEEQLVKHFLPNALFFFLFKRKH